MLTISPNNKKKTDCTDLDYLIWFNSQAYSIPVCIEDVEGIWMAREFTWITFSFCYAKIVVQFHPLKLHHYTFYNTWVAILHFFS